MSGKSGPLGGVRGDRILTVASNPITSGLAVREGWIAIMADGSFAWLGAAGAWRSLPMLGALYAMTNDLSTLFGLSAISNDIHEATTRVLSAGTAAAHIDIPDDITGIADHDGYDFPTGVGTATKRLEYKRTAGYVAAPGAVTMDIVDAADWDDARTVLKATIAANSTAVLNSEDHATPGRYRVYYDWVSAGAVGNVPIVQTFTLAGWDAVGFAFGLDALSPLGLYAVMLANLLAAAPDLTLARNILGHFDGLDVVVPPYPSAGQGSDLRLLSGAAHGPGVHDGGWISLLPGAGAGGGYDGAIHLAGSTFRAAEFAALLARAQSYTGGHRDPVVVHDAAFAGVTAVAVGGLSSAKRYRVLGTVVGINTSEWLALLFDGAVSGAYTTVVGQAAQSAYGASAWHFILGTPGLVHAFNLTIEPRQDGLIRFHGGVHNTGSAGNYCALLSGVTTRDFSTLAFAMGTELRTGTLKIIEDTP
jgi:hypothetical protein